MQNTKKLILMRGIPSSGKSFLAKELCLKVESPTNIYSTDDNFMRYENGGWTYKFDPKMLREYHKYNLDNAISAMALGLGVIVDNTNTTFDEMLPYILAGLAVGYEIEFVEPSTEWRYDVEECFKRNSHGVPKEAIQRMKDRFESTELCSYKLELLKEFLYGDLRKLKTLPE